MRQILSNDWGVAHPRDTICADGMRRYRASKHDCETCALKHRCVPKEPARKILRSTNEGARDMARDIAKTDAYVISRHQRKKVEMLFAHLKRILKLDRLRLRGPNGARDEFHLAATAQNLRKLAKLVPVAEQRSRKSRHEPISNRSKLRLFQQNRPDPAAQRPLKTSAQLV